MKLTNKLMLGFLSVVILFSISGYYVIFKSKEALQKAYIENTTLLAGEILDKIDRNIYHYLEEFQSYSRDRILQEHLRESNKYFDSMTNAQNYIDRHDKDWTSAPKGEITPFMQALINNRLSEELRDKIEFYKKRSGHKVFGEIFVTNKFGANVAQTGKTTDYRQDDETWWQKAKKNGLYIKDVDYDDSADVRSIDFDIRIDDEEGNFLGIMKVVLNIEDVFSIIDTLKSDKTFRNIAQFKLVSKEGKLIYSSENIESFKGIFLEPVTRFGPLDSPVHKQFAIGTDPDRKEKLFVHAHSKGYNDYKGLGWIFIVELDMEKIIDPTNRLKNQILIVFLSFTALGALMGIIVSANIVKPIKKLMKAANKIGEGNLDAHIDIRSKDEIGILAKTFNEMAKKLKQSNEGLESTNQELQIEVSERRQAEQKLQEQRALLEETVKKRTEELSVEVEERRQAEGKLRAMLDSIEDHMSMMDRDLNILWANETATQIFGDDIIGKKCYTVYQKREKPCEPYPCFVLKAFQDGKIHEHDTQVIDKDGNMIYSHCTANVALRDREGKPAAVFEILRDITSRKQAEEKIRLQLDHLKTLRNIDMAITGSMDLRVTLNVLLEEVLSQLGMDAARVFLFNKHTMTLECAAGKGFNTDTLTHSCMMLGEGCAGHVAFARKTLFIPDLSEAEEKFSCQPYFNEEGFKTYAGIPLIAKGQVKGILEIFRRTPYKPEEEWLDFFEALARQAAIAIDNATMLNDLQQSHDKLVIAYDRTIEGWAKALDYRDKETEGHSQRVTEITLRIAREMGIGDDELIHIRRGALLHDIGKLGVPDNILFKPGKLTDEEEEIMKRHTTLARELLSPIDFLRPSLDIPYCHHEKWDGTGYPRGLKGDAIPLSARIFTVVDVWDALNTDRPYRPAWTKKKVEKYLRDNAGSHFDPEVVEAFLKIKW